MSIVAVPSPERPGSGSEGCRPQQVRLSAIHAPLATPVSLAWLVVPFSIESEISSGTLGSAAARAALVNFHIERQIMNVVDGLQHIRERLVENDAEAATLSTVDLFIKRASLPAAKNASVNSQIQLVRMLMRTQDANNNVRIYNDLVRLEEEMESGAAQAQAERAIEEAKPVPKTKKYYKEQKEREKKMQSGS